MINKRQRIAIIGSGISGLASAYLLRKSHDVVLFESGDYLGGHTNTVDVTLEGQTHPVDTGFLVLNDRTYPNLIAMFDELGVETYASDMSFGVSMDQGSLEWAGTNLDTVFAQRKHLLSPRFLGMLRDIMHFNSASERNLEETLRSQATLGQLLDANDYGDAFRDAYLLPMAAAIWSSAPADILKFPAATFLRFCINHALLQVNNRPLWRTVKGGAREYVRKIARNLPDIRIKTPVQRVMRTGEGVNVSTLESTERFDSVVFATHAPTTLHLLSDASAEEHAVLAPCRYQANVAYLHTDLALMPKLHKVWSAWNYLSSRKADANNAVCVTYWLNKLQNLPFSTPVLVTLNPSTPPAADKTLAKFDYEHPVFDQPAITAQTRLTSIQGHNKVWFAGAWTGYGFHEDGLKSALRVAKDFGLAPDWAKL